MVTNAWFIGFLKGVKEGKWEEVLFDCSILAWSNAWLIIPLYSMACEDFGTTPQIYVTPHPKGDTRAVMFLWLLINRNIGTIINHLQLDKLLLPFRIPQRCQLVSLAPLLQSHRLCDQLGEAYEVSLVYWTFRRSIIMASEMEKKHILRVNSQQEALVIPNTSLEGVTGITDSEMIDWRLKMFHHLRQPISIQQKLWILAMMVYHIVTWFLILPVLATRGPSFPPSVCWIFLSISSSFYAEIT